MDHSIIIPVHNALPTLKSLLDNLDEVTLPSNVVLVDDASDAETARALKDFTIYRSVVADTVLLRNDRQQLFTRTVNRGIRYADNCWNSAVVTIVNTDCALKEGWLFPLLEALEDPKIGMAGYWDNDYPKVDLKKQPYTEVKAPNYVTGHCFSLKMAMLREIGVLCETDVDGRHDRTLAPYHGQAHIGSERILSNKANLYGWKTVYVNAPLVQHGTGASWGRDLRWLNEFILDPLWTPTDTLDEPEWY